MYAILCCRKQCFLFMYYLHFFFLIVFWSCHFSRIYLPFLTQLSLFFRFDLRAFRWVQTMVFAIEEINKNPRLLPGVKLGYRILDSCDNVHTSLQSAFSLVNGSSLHQTEGSASRTLPCLSKAPVPAIIGLASSTPTRAVAQTFGPFGIPMVSIDLKDAENEWNKLNTAIIIVAVSIDSQLFLSLF